jgi:glutathione peroxidase
MTVTEIALTGLDGHPTSLADYSDRAVLVVNVASKCGLTPQYAALEQLARDYGGRGLTVLGVPCKPRPRSTARAGTRSTRN